ncbi:hypothetical protein SAMN05216391_10845 [Lachnospiraceae bacterium KHCPX20]|nr:hypothetical protein SAMN05216391_10845 [Lachnospiraceae bacterium KHCPX20]
MYLNKDEILNSLTKDDIIRIVTYLGSGEPRHDSKGNLIFQTICHNQPDPSNSYKLYYYHEPQGRHNGRVFHCYSGCDDSFNIIELVMRANRMQGKTLTWYKALYWIGSFTGKLSILKGDSLKTQTKKINDFSWINRIKAVTSKGNEVTPFKELNEHILEIFYYAPHELWLNDNISLEALGRFEIGYYGLTNQITIPHRDMDNRLIGIRGRYIDEDDIERIGKYVPLQVNGEFLAHHLGNNLYGLNVVKDKVMRCKKIMLVEGEKSCMQAYTYFGEDSFVCAVCGSNITPEQVRIIIQDLKVSEVIVGFDKEYEDSESYDATIYYNKLVRTVAPLVPYVKVCLLLDKEDLLPYKGSPTDKGKDVLLRLLDNKIQITMKEVQEVLEDEQ